MNAAVVKKVVSQGGRRSLERVMYRDLEPSVTGNRAGSTAPIRPRHSANNKMTDLSFSRVHNVSSSVIKRDN